MISLIRLCLLVGLMVRCVEADSFTMNIKFKNAAHAEDHGHPNHKIAVYVYKTPETGIGSLIKGAASKEDFTHHRFTFVSECKAVTDARGITHLTFDRNSNEDIYLFLTSKLITHEVTTKQLPTVIDVHDDWDQISDTPHGTQPIVNVIQAKLKKKDYNGEVMVKLITLNKGDIALGHEGVVWTDDTDMHDHAITLRNKNNVPLANHHITLYTQTVVGAQGSNSEYVKDDQVLIGQTNAAGVLRVHYERKLNHFFATEPVTGGNTFPNKLTHVGSPPFGPATFIGNGVPAHIPIQLRRTLPYKVNFIWTLV